MGLVKKKKGGPCQDLQPARHCCWQRVLQETQIFLSQFPLSLINNPYRQQTYNPTITNNQFRQETSLV